MNRLRRGTGARTNGAAGVGDGRCEGELDLRHLAALAAIARDGSLRRAAQRLEVAPATLARWIARLEASAERPLVERQRRGAILTDAGQLLLRHADAVEAAMRAARDDLDALAAGETGVVRLGTVAGRSGRLAAQVAAALTLRRPRLGAASVDFPDEERAIAALSAGHVDVLLAELPLPGTFDACELLRDPAVLLVPAGSALAEHATPLSAVDLSQMRLVAPRSRLAYARLAQALRRCGARPRITQHVDEIPTVHALVAAGLASAIMPRLAVEPHDHGTVAVDLGHLLQSFTVALAWRAGDRRPAIVAVREAARDASREVVAHRSAIDRVAD